MMASIRKPLLAAMIFLGIAPPAVLAQEYPTRPIQLVIPFTPGGSTDTVGRAIGQRLAVALGQPVVIENRPGAGTNVGTAYVAKAAPDGYTLLQATSSLAINPSLYKNLTFDPTKELTPVILVTDSPQLLVVNSSAPFNSVRELIAYARANPGKLSYGSSGNGATNHLAMELFKTLAKVSMVHIPYKGGGPAVTGLIAGDVQLMFLPPVVVEPHLKSGRIKAIAVSTASRFPGIDLPSVAEAGLPGFVSSVWFAFYAPAGTPRPIIEKLNTAINRILQEPEVAAQFSKGGMKAGGGTPEDMGALYKAELERFAAVVKASGTKVD